jgi:hypothetical protein
MWPSRERLDTRHERGSEEPRDAIACDDNGSANSASDNSANPPASSLTQP